MQSSSSRARSCRGALLAGLALPLASAAGGGLVPLPLLLMAGEGGW